VLKLRARSRLPRLALLTVAGLAATAGIAFATTAVTNAFTDSQGVYHGCVGNGSGHLRVVTPGEGCKPSETAIDWNRVGPQGPQGTQGPKGYTGATGTTGAAGLTGPSFIGSACTYEDGTPGTVQMTNPGTDGIITLHCEANPTGGGGGGNLCPSPLPAYPNATTVCNGSTGAVSIQCNIGWADVNGQIQDGCETQGHTPEFCNGIDDDLDGIVDDHLVDVPSLPHATAVCAPARGGYVIQSCDPGWQDADGIVADGCEQQL